MRKLILKMSLSLDAFVGGPNGEIDWIFRSMDDKAAAWTIDTISNASLHIMGSRTFNDMINYWPTSTEPFAQPMNEIPKAVFTRSDDFHITDSAQTTRALKDANQLGHSKTIATSHMSTWTGATILHGNLEEEISKLKQQNGKPIIAHGGASFAQNLMQTRLIDEYHLLILPTALGQGLPLFSKLDKPLDLELIETRSFPRGAVAKTYKAKK